MAAHLFLNTGRTPLARPRPVSPDALAFHRRLPGYARTPLLELRLAHRPPGVARVLVKAETSRYGLPSFKALGAFWATWRVLRERLGPTRRPATLDDLADALAAAGPLPRLAAATDGNHGRAVARMARMLGLPCTIFVPRGLAPARVDALRAEGAEVVVVDGSYDDAVALSAAAAGPDVVVVSDTAWEGYEDAPRWVVEGYATIFAELDDQLRAFGGWAAVDLLVVPLGVGGLGAAAAARTAVMGPERPVVAGVEPVTAACVRAAVEAGRPCDVPGPHPSIMSGLNCGRVSPVALPAIQAEFDAFATITDDECRQAVRALAAAGLDVGECGAAGLAALDHLPRPGGADAGSTVLLLATEGVTDPVGFRAIVGRSPQVAGRAA